MKNEEYDIIIIGAGPAGLTAGIYAARYKLSTLIIGNIIGGYVSEAVEIHNYPGFEKIKGIELAKKILTQTQKLGVKISPENVQQIKKTSHGFEVKTNLFVYFAKKLIIASGREKQKLEVKGEKELIGKGVAYCSTCDAPLYKDKTVVIVGGGNSALTSALLLTKYAKKVYIIYRREKFFRADPTWQEKVNKEKKIEKIFKANIKEIKGKNKVESVILESNKEIKTDGVFIEVGSAPSMEIAKQLNLKTEKNYIFVNKNQETSIKGVFAAGDITNNPLKQIITAAAEGAIAAFSAYKEIKKQS